VPELIGLVLPGGPEFARALRSIWDRGDVAAPLPWDAPAAHRESLLAAVDPDWVLTPEGTTRYQPADDHPLRPVEAERTELIDGDALVICTSGTTGRPRAAIHTHAGVEAAAFATSTALGVAPDVRWLACLPLHHVGGCSVLTRAWHTGAGLEIVPRATPEVVERAALAGCTHVSLVPTLLRRIDPTPWRVILLGGAAAPTDRPANTVATYGCTETYGGVVYDGLALNGVSVRVTLEPGEHWSVPAPIELRTPSLLRAYRTGTDPVADDGWFRTGDLGMIDPDTGRLSVTGRADDVIVSGGENVWPQPVEDVLASLDSIEEVAIVGRSDPEWGERVVAVVVPAERSRPPTLEALRAAVRAVLPSACAPREMELRDCLPRTTLGKIERYRLRTPDTGASRP
jgi:O-succinylbenzoic acid--CoA ligase